MQSSETARLPLATVAAASATAPTTAGTALWKRRSPRRSELRPMTTIAIAAPMYGIIEYKPICMVSVTPSALRIEGSQKLTV